MAFDPGLAQRIRGIVRHGSDIDEKRMFGGLAFMRRGHTFVGVIGETSMARVGPSKYAAALSQAHVREMDVTGRPSTGYVCVDPPGLDTDAQLATWIDECVDAVATLPAKSAKRASRSAPARHP